MAINISEKIAQLLATKAGTISSSEMLAEILTYIKTVEGYKEDICTVAGNIAEISSVATGVETLVELSANTDLITSITEIETNVTDLAEAAEINALAASVSAEIAENSVGIAGADGIDGVKGDTGDQGIQGIQGIQGETGADSVVAGPQGIQGVIGLDGSQGIQGVQGIQGDTGTVGSDGAVGEQGIQGIQGVTGAAGTNGTDGIDGQDGAIGATGADGVAGSGVTVIGSDTIVNILNQSGTAGDMWISTSSGVDDDSNAVTIGDGIVYGTNWLTVGPIRGEKGDTGTTGATGATGTAGTNGTNGIDGLDGITGDTGAKGDTGDTGSDGIQGLQGIQGIQGIQGEAGIQGITGEEGYTPIKGTDYFDGEAGAQGIQGIQGAQGVQGSIGETGLQGIQGIRGDVGADSIVAGPQGDQGIQGNIGLTGDQGTQGLQGIQGTQGDQGTQGSIGLQGIQGIQGIQGEAGADGTIVDVDALVARIVVLETAIGIIESETLPVFVSQTIEYIEGQLEDAIIGTLTASDNIDVTGFIFEDSNDTTSADSYFTLDSQGNIYISTLGVDSVYNDYEVGSNSIVYNIIASDNVGNNTIAPVTFSCLDKTDETAPTFVDQSFSYEEGQSNTVTTLGTLVSSDNIAVTEFLFADSGTRTSADGYFRLANFEVVEEDNLNPYILFTESGLLSAYNDYELNGNAVSYDVIAYDAQGNSTTAIITLSCTNTDEIAPTFNNQTINYWEGQTADTVVGALVALDDVEIVSFTFFNSGTTTSSDGYFTVDVSGNLTITSDGAGSAYNINGGSVAYNLVATDNQENTTTATVTLTAYEETTVTLGSELVSNGTFDTDTTGWNDKYSVDTSIENGRARVTASAASTNPAIAQQLTVEVGETYQLHASGYGGTETTSIRFGMSDELQNILGSSATGDNLVSTTFVATSVDVYITLLGTGLDENDYVEFDNISVKKQITVNNTLPTNVIEDAVILTGDEPYTFDGVDDSILLTEKILDGDFEFSLNAIRSALHYGAFISGSNVRFICMAGDAAQLDVVVDGTDNIYSDVLPVTTTTEMNITVTRSGSITTLNCNDVVTDISDAVGTTTLYISSIGSNVSATGDGDYFDGIIQDVVITDTVGTTYTYPIIDGWDSNPVIEDTTGSSNGTAQNFQESGWGYVEDVSDDTTTGATTYDGLNIVLSSDADQYDGSGSVSFYITYDDTLSDTQTLSMTTGDELQANNMEDIALGTTYTISNLEAGTYPIRAVIVDNADSSSIISDTVSTIIHDSSSSELASVEAVTLTVGTEEKQIFKGTGVSAGYGHGSAYNVLSDEQKTEYSAKLYSDMGLKCVRIWTRTAGDYNQLYNDQINNGLYERMIANGVEEILYAQLLFPSAYTTTTNSGTTLTDIDGYTAYLAAFLKRARDEAGINFTATGIINEPLNGTDHQVADGDWPTLVKSMRDALDSQGLTNIKVVPTDCTGPYGTQLDTLEGILASPISGTSVDAISGHSYTISANIMLADAVENYNTEYWQTESGTYDNEPGGFFNYRIASTAAAIFLNDINFMTSYWFWFGSLGIGDQDGQQSLLYWDEAKQAAGDSDWIQEHYQYYTVKHISKSFLPNTTMRIVSASDHTRAGGGQATSVIGDMSVIGWWTNRPPFNCAAGLRDDGKWAVGIVNSTAYDDEMPDWFMLEHPATEYALTIDIQELAGTGDRVFNVERTNRNIACSSIETITVTDGQATMYLQPNELVTLVEQ